MKALLKTDPENTDKDLSDVQRYYLDNGGYFAVIVDGGEVIGSYGIYKIDSTCCELRKMYLLSDYQGRGLGKKMMDEALEKARELGFETMILETNTVLTKASHLYKKYGFEEFEPPHLSSRCNLSLRKKL